MRRGWRPVRWARHLASGLVRRLNAKWTLLTSDDPPAIVYQMGKVGSKTVERTLEAHGVVPAFHIHRMAPAHIRTVKQQDWYGPVTRPLDALGLALHGAVVRKHRPARFISLVRDPVGRNVSAFFENYRHLVGEKYRDSDMEVGRMIDRFLTSYPHEVPLTWFDHEVRDTLGIDVFAQPSPAEPGWMTAENPPFRLLVLKLEADDVVLAKALGSFVGVDDLELVRANVGAEKEYAKDYAEFKRRIRLPGEYLDRMYGSRYAKHFYTDEELASFRKRWSS